MINTYLHCSLIVLVLQLNVYSIKAYKIGTAFQVVDQSNLHSYAPPPSLSIRTNRLNAVLVESGFDFVYPTDNDIDNEIDTIESIYTDITTTTTPSYYGPPIGAKYESQLRFPVLGTQSFTLHIRSRTEAHLVAAGRLAIDEPVVYSFNDGKLTFQMSEKLKSTMKRFLTQLQEVGYDFHTDTPYVKVLPPLPTAIKIFLKRVNKSF